MYNIHITKVKGYTYTGYILDSELTDDQLKALGLTRDSEYQNEIPVEGDFFVDWDDDIAMPQIENCQVLGAPNGGTYKQWISVQYCDLEWNGPDTPRKGMVTVKSVAIDVPATYTLDLDLEQVNLEKMENDVSEWDTGDWAADRISSQIDAAYDSYMDR